MGGAEQTEYLSRFNNADSIIHSILERTKETTGKYKLAAELAYRTSYDQTQQVMPPLHQAGECTLLCKQVQHQSQCVKEFNFLSHSCNN